jgi:hypothetical protein
VAAALDRQLDDNDAWLPTQRHSDTAVASTASAAKVTLATVPPHCNDPGNMSVGANMR